MIRIFLVALIGARAEGLCRPDAELKGVKEQDGGIRLRIGRS